jgi:nucleoside-diphosphate-sugar epimerase
MTRQLLIFGLGYTGRAVATLARDAGWQVTATERRQGAPLPGIRTLPFDQAALAIAQATHVLATAPPGDSGDPALAAFGAELAAAPALRAICYLSTTGVYGDRGGAWVDETTEPAPQSPRAHRRLAAEQAWSALANRRAVDLFRLAGIYGPGRSALDDVRAGRARRIIAPDHKFGRIHRDDIAGAVLAALARETPGLRVLHGNDDLPAASAEVIAEAATLLNLPLPPAIPLAEAWPGMSEMARSFWSENRRVASARTQAELARRWTYPTYREGLRAILTAE